MVSTIRRWSGTPIALRRNHGQTASCRATSNTSDPQTTTTLDPLEWIHRLTAHIPDPDRHCRRFYGAYSNRRRVVTARPQGDSADAAVGSHEDRDIAESSSEARSTWARLVRRIFEADPLVCSRGARMRILSFITDPLVLDRILRNRQNGRCKVTGPFEPRAPPTAGCRP